MPTITDEEIGTRMWQDTKAHTLGMLKEAGMGAGQKQLTPDDERRMWMEEAEGWTVDKELAMLAEGKTRGQVGAMKYPHRQKMMATGERYFSKYEQAAFASSLSKKIDPTWAPPPPKTALPTMPPLPSEDEMATPTSMPFDEIGG